MTIFVIVHGAWGGSWGWRSFANLLRADGHEVYTPSLTGLGERVHLGGPQTNLSTHICDVENTIFYQDLHDLVLVGASYGGMVVTGVADRLPERIKHLVYSDAFLPRDGESCFDLGGAGGPERATIVEGWKVMPMTPPQPQALTEEMAFRQARRTPQPRGTLEEKVRLAVPLEERDFSRTYIKAGQPPRQPRLGRDFSHFWEAADRTRSDPRWRYFEIACGHGIHLEMPDDLKKVLEQVVDS